ncbi:unnamed protein product [Oikopleura dioica]|uniref:CAP-Gly domain-containing protein n=1 Tax=Oikopleura dioica TaxID=34765 RepID=E4XDK7_OIKDI|nr:unnamed protein product [Oikopleura dioica]
MSGLKPPSKIRPPKVSVGVRVIASGKPGVVAFIGETEFASGVWAGVVLDEPIGKNDGSIKGKRYFQTSENRGVFIRPEKLEMDKSRSGTPTTAPPATPSPKLKPRLTPESPDIQEALKVGDSILYSGKSGTVRFMGRTEFKEGIWVGIELNEPSGKNDGTVQGVSYFKCPPKFGLFAPPHKVTKLKGGRTKGPGSVANRSIRVFKYSFTKARSPAGSVSSFGSVASTNSVAMARSEAAHEERMRARALQCNAKEFKAIMDEKEKQVASMLQERELDRDEIVKISGQVLELRTTTELEKEELTVKIQELDGNIDNLKSTIQSSAEGQSDEVTQTLAQLAEKKELVEDLEFQLDEAKLSVKTLSTQITDATQRYESEKLASNEEISKIRNELGESKSTAADLASRLEKMVDECGSLQSQNTELGKKSEQSSAQVLQELRDAKQKAENAEKQLELAHEQIASLRNENEASKDEATRLEEEKNTIFMLLLEKLCKLVSETSELKQQFKEKLESAKASVDEKSTNLENLKLQHITAVEELEKSQKSAEALEKEKNDSIRSLTEELEKHSISLQESSSKNETLSEEIKKKENELCERDSKISSLENVITEKTSEIQSALEKAKECESQLNDIKESSSKSSSELEIQVQTLAEDLRQKASLLEKKSGELASFSELIENERAQLKESENKVIEISKSLDEKSKQATSAKEHSEKLEAEIASLKVESEKKTVSTDLSKTQQELDELKTQHSSATTIIEEKSKEIQNLESERATKLEEFAAFSTKQENLISEKNNIEKCLHEKQEDHLAATAELSSAKQDLDVSSQRVIALEKQISELKEVSSKSSGELEYKTAELLSQIATLTTEKQEESSKRIELEEQLKSTQAEIAEGSEIMAASVKEIEMLKEKTASLDRELADAKAENVEKDSQHKEASDTIYNLSKELSDLQERVWKFIMQNKQIIKRNCIFSGAFSLQKRIEQFSVSEKEVIRNRGKTWEKIKFGEESTATTALSEKNNKALEDLNAKIEELKLKDAEIENLKKSNAEVTEENAEKVNQYGKNIGELSGQIEELEKFLVEKDEQIKMLQSSQSSKSAELDDILVEKNKCITEMSEQIEAEIHSKDQAIKTQEKTLQKYEDLKAILSDEKTKAEAVKELNLKMEEEITVKNVKIQDFTIQMASLQNEILEKESEVLEVNEKLVKKRKRADLADTLELENQTLQIRISELEKGSKSNGIVSIVNANGSGDGDSGVQTEFLNSIIAGQQKDIDKLHERIHELEAMLIDDPASSSPSGQDSTMFFDTTVSSVKKTTRSYCDICEEFDMHETEDCPTQNDAGDNYAVKNTAPAWDDDDDETF